MDERWKEIERIYHVAREVDGYADGIEKRFLNWPKSALGGDRK